MGTSWGTSHVLESKVLLEIAEARGKSVAQVCIRWVLQELSQEDLDKISQIPQRKMMHSKELISANGPYKSLEDLWDGEI
ncbi:hypothetical protein M0R45_021718 [Rubus argutus]|uniref:NADP-dependent oxidoreductase domain-containing protein n=1 Tax=Rubus argutus TaxID=59490 RepID=A0AAW1XEE8_RUBAR